jgi:peroxiredoxin
MTTLKQGDKAPEFNALDEYERSVSLTDFLGKKSDFIFLSKRHDSRVYYRVM